MARWRSADARRAPGPCGGRRSAARSLARGSALAASLLAGIAGPAARAEEPAVLHFARHGEPVASLGRSDLERIAAPRVVRVFEPYEQAVVRFEAVPLDVVLDHVYGRSWREEEELLFTCRDGYQPSVPAQRAQAHTAWIALDRPGPQGFTIEKHESGRLQRIELSPAYLVWDNLEDGQVRQEGDYGWPYQLVGVDLVRTRERFPKMAPPPDAPGAVRAGFRAFRRYCSRCHPLNGEGGRIGPELNGPEPVVRTRGAEWLRQWIDDPSRMLPTARMPRLDPQLPDREETIDEILAYLRAMARASAPSAPPAGGAG